MTEEQYYKLKQIFYLRNCPICGQQVINCMNGWVNIFSEDGQTERFENIEIPDEEYIEKECPYCSFVMRYHIKSLFK